MQRRSDGIIVPKYKIDNFTGNTSGSGVLSVTLTYIPKSLEHILVESRDSSISQVYGFDKTSLTGKVLTLTLKKKQYNRANTPIATTDAAGGGAVAEPHSHTLGYSLTNLTLSNPGVINNLQVSVMYEVA